MIQICIAMSESGKSNFNIIIQKIIKKSLFTERQIEIILKKKKMLYDDISLNITKGAYYRQVVQSRKKIEGLYYSIILLQGLDVISPDDITSLFPFAESISNIGGRSAFDDGIQAQITSVVDQAVKQAVRL